MSILQIHKDLVDANSTLEKLLGNMKKTELAEEVMNRKKSFSYWSDFNILGQLNVTRIGTS